MRYENCYEHADTVNIYGFAALSRFDGFGGNQWSPGGRWSSTQRLGGHMALMEMHPRNNKLCHDYLVRVVANMLHVSSNLLVPLVQMLD
jgi:hypothetical protein